MLCRNKKLFNVSAPTKKKLTIINFVGRWRKKWIRQEKKGQRWNFSGPDSPISLPKPHLIVDSYPPSLTA